MFQIIGAMAEFERALIQERVRAGLRNAKAKGKRLAVRGVLWTLPELPFCVHLAHPGARLRENWGLDLPLSTG